MKVSKTQEEVLRLMAEDWELGTTGGFEPRYWLQKGGIGRSGESKTVSSATFFALWDKGLIEKESAKFPFTYYKLTDK